MLFRSSIIQGTDLTQNTQIAGIQGVDLAQNSSISIIQGVDLTQNTQIAGIQGVDLAQNASITIIQGVDNTQNVQIQGIQGVDLAQNASITIIQGVDLTQNTWISSNVSYIAGVDAGQNTTITAVNNFAQGAYNQANGANGLAQGAFIKANTPWGYLANGSYTAVLNSSGQFVLPNIVTGGYTGGTMVSTQAFIMNAGGNLWAFDTNGQLISPYNVKLTTAGVAFADGTLQNTAAATLAYSQAGFGVANSASANTVITQGVDATQNTQIGGIQGVDLAQNASITIIQGVDLTQNTQISGIQGVDLAQNSSISIIQGVDLTQNTWISSNVSMIAGVDATQNTQIAGIQGVDLAQNSAISIIQGVDLGQNSAISIIQGVDLGQNATITAVNQYAAGAYALSNTNASNISITNGVDATQNSWISSNSAYTQAAFNQANTANTRAYNTVLKSGDTMTGALNITNGSVGITSATAALGVNGSIVSNNSLYMGGTGFFGTANGATEFPNALISAIGNSPTYSQIVVQNGNAGLNSSSDFVATADNGTDSSTFIDMGINSSIYNQAGYGLTGPNDGYLYVQGNTSTGGGNLVLSTYTPKDIIFSQNGGDTPNETARFQYGVGLVMKNLPITFADGTSQNTAGSSVANTIYLQNVNNYQNTQIGGIQGVDLAQNSAISIIQGVDLGQNATITAVNQFAQGAYNTANTDVTTISTTAGIYGGSAAIPVITLAANGRVSSITNTAISIPAGTTIVSSSSISANANTGIVQLTVANTTVTPGTYGSSTQAPVITVGQDGRITTLTTATISGGGGGGGSGTTISFQSTNTASYIATTGQTAFSIAYTVPYVQVYINGSKLDTSEYTATSGTGITLTTPAVAGEVVDLIGFTYINTANFAFAIANTTASTSNTTGALTVAGGAGITGNVFIGGTLTVAGNTIIENTYINNFVVNTTDSIVTTNTTPATSNTTGAVIVAGGLGVSGNIYGGTVYSNGSDVIGSALALAIALG